MPTAFLLVASICLAAARVSGHKSPAFQAVAHLFVGCLLGLYVADRSRKNCLMLAVLLSVIELACFLVFKGHSGR